MEWRYKPKRYGLVARAISPLSSPNAGGPADDCHEVRSVRDDSAPHSRRVLADW
jgi:hypothetical protein